MKLNKYNVEKCEAEKNIFKKRYKIYFLFVRNVIKKLNILNNILSNNIIFKLKKFS